MNKYFQKFTLARPWSCRYFIYLYFLVAITGSSSCHRNSGPKSPSCPDFEVPDGIILEISKNGVFITDSVFLGQIKMSYSSGGSKQYVPDLKLSQGFFESDGQRHFVLVSENAEIESTFDGIKLFYLEYPDGSSNDVVYLDMVRTPATNCQYDISGILVNSVRPLTDSLFVAGGVDSTYVVNHQ
jgi:hypothetical protein